MSSADDVNEDKLRREDELEALKAIYYDDGAVETTTSHDYKSDTDLECWLIRISPQVTLEVRLPSQYPSQKAPIPRVKAPQYVLNDANITDLTQELQEMWTPDMEIVIVWAEHCRMFVEELNNGDEAGAPGDGEEASQQQQPEEEEEQPASTAANGTYTFVPPTSKYGQPIRHFDLSVIQNDAENKTTIHHGPPFRPPKSGASETLVAHVASVQSMNQVNWVLAQLLSDKKIAKATHNMIAYRFVDAQTRTLVSDNDDDGEKGSGSKLAALLELTNCDNVIVVVSRWYGGIHLGPARFKWFASVARDALEEFGFLPTTGTGKKK